MGAICARAIEQARLGSHEISVWGTGQQIRDWIHIHDIITMVLATHSLVKSGTILNLCTGIGVSMTDLAALAMRAAYDVLDKPCPPKIEVHPMVDKPSGVMRRIGCPERLHTLTKPAVITVQEGVHSVVRYLVENAP